MLRCALWLLVVALVGCPSPVLPDAPGGPDPDGDDDDDSAVDPGRPDDDPSGDDDSAGGGDDDDDDALGDNLPPQADAGVDLEIRLGDRVELSGARSTDPEERPLAYYWSIRERPPESYALLEDADTVSPELEPDVLGLWTISLVVWDGTHFSDWDSLRIVVLGGIADEGVPIADAGDDRTVPVGTEVRLDAGRSADPEGAPLTYAWSFTSYASPGPPDLLPDASAARPSFLVSHPGRYEVALVVSDGTFDSEPDFVEIVGGEADDGCGCGASGAGVLRLPDGSLVPLRGGSPRPPLQLLLLAGFLGLRRRRSSWET